MAKLIIQTGKLRGRVLTIPTHEVIIGRDAECAIRMGSDDISRRHCALLANADGIQVRDLGSSNGTFVNGFPIQSTVQLKPGDRLTVGPAEFLVEGPKPRHTVEENVADWLADGDSKVGLLNEQDTTILKGDADFANAAPAAPVPPPSVVPRPRSRRKFASLAEEASDIIRRHLETLERASDS